MQRTEAASLNVLRIFGRMQWCYTDKTRVTLHHLIKYISLPIVESVV